MTIWTFKQAGSMPGIPGTFAGVQVEVDDATNTILSQTPLAMHSEFLAADEVEQSMPIEKETQSVEQGNTPETAEQS